MEQSRTDRTGTGTVDASNRRLGSWFPARASRRSLLTAVPVVLSIAVVGATAAPAAAKETETLECLADLGVF